MNTACWGKGREMRAGAESGFAAAAIRRPPPRGAVRDAAVAPRGRVAERHDDERGGNRSPDRRPNQELGQKRGMRKLAVMRRMRLSRPPTFAKSEKRYPPGP